MITRGAVDLALTVKGSGSPSDADGMRRIRLPASRLPAAPDHPRPASVIPDDELRAAARTRAAVEAVLEQDGFDREFPLIPQIRERLALAGA